MYGGPETIEIALKEPGRLRSCLGGKIWDRRYQAIVISDEEAAQVDHLRYVLAHGAKEDLVESPEDWPGSIASASSWEASR